MYAQVTGLGLGVWLFSAKAQRSAYVRAFQDAIERNARLLDRIAVVDFSWVSNAPFDGSKLVDGGAFPGTDIRTRFSRRDPFAALPPPPSGEEEELLVVAMYAWDGNALPGNEYWDGHLSASGDPAAACCSQVPEFQNTHINREAMSAANLHVASPRLGGIVKFADYVSGKD